jgi:hypothetical protein
MNITNHPSFDPNKVGAGRAVGFRFIDERKVIKDINPTQLLVNDIAAVRDIKWRRELRHFACICRRGLSPCVRATLEPSARCAIRNLTEPSLCRLPNCRGRRRRRP